MGRGERRASGQGWRHCRPQPVPCLAAAHFLSPFLASGRIPASAAGSRGGGVAVSDGQSTRSSSSLRRTEKALVDPESSSTGSVISFSQSALLNQKGRTQYQCTVLYFQTAVPRRTCSSLCESDPHQKPGRTTVSPQTLRTVSPMFCGPLW